MVPAAAETESFTDANDRKGFDIRVVKVRYGDRLTIRVDHDGKIAVGQKYKFWIDTRPRDKGPEFSFVFAPNSDFARFRRVDGFADRGRAVKKCGQEWGGSADIFKPHRDVVAIVGVGCLRTPARVRVSAQLVVNGEDDWAPRYRRLYGRVTRY